MTEAGKKGARTVRHEDKKIRVQTLRSQVDRAGMMFETARDACMPAAYHATISISSLEH